MAAIAERITSDPPLTAYILKIANSAAYQLVRKVASIREAVTIIGTTGLRNIILQYGVSLIMGRLPASAVEMWRRSSQVAYFARVLAQRRHASPTLVDDVLVGSVLHDIGMIVQYAVDPKLIKRIETLCRRRGMPTRLLEDVLAGLNHARIGGLLSRKWNFPEALIQIIEFHHRPWAAAPEYRRATGLVYLADCLCDSGEGNVAFDQVDRDILREHGARDAASFEALRSEIAAAYAKDSR
jgi:HD-like signal output (HDOD) protein